MSTHNFKKLRVWQIATELIDAVYDYAESLPDNEKSGLRSRITRCSVFIPGNIAVEFSKSSKKEFARFLPI